MEANDLGITGISALTQVGATPAVAAYRAIDDATGQPVVVKVLTREATPEVRARFDYDQARLVELREHPCVVEVLSHGYTSANRPYVVSAAVEGGSMADKVGSGLDGPGVIALGIRVAGALESADRRDVVHGDLRPEDVLIDGNGEPEVSDFGLAMVTGHGPDRATDVARLAHAAPEQLQTHLPSPSTDVYALGSVLYTLLAGRPAFVRPEDASVAVVGARIITEPPPSLRGGAVPDPVVDAIERAMAKDPAQRWATAEAFGLALQQAEITLGLPITPMTVIGPDRVVPRPVVEEEPSVTKPVPAAKSKRSPMVFALLGLVAVAVVAVFLVLSGDDGGDDDEGTRAPVTRPDAPDVDLTDVSDDSGTLSLGVLERWDDVDGRPLGGDPDVVAAEDADAFLDLEGFAVSGIEVTLVAQADDTRRCCSTSASRAGVWPTSARPTWRPTTPTSPASRVCCSGSRVAPATPSSSSPVSARAGGSSPRSTSSSRRTRRRSTPSSRRSPSSDGAAAGVAGRTTASCSRPRRRRGAAEPST